MKKWLLVLYVLVAFACGPDHLWQYDATVILHTYEPSHMTTTTVSMGKNGSMTIPVTHPARYTLTMRYDNRLEPLDVTEAVYRACRDDEHVQLACRTGCEDHCQIVSDCDGLVH